MHDNSPLHQVAVLHCNTGTEHLFYRQVSKDRHQDHPKRFHRHMHAVLPQLHQYFEWNHVLGI